jgi:SsrA-binding protein
MSQSHDKNSLYKIVANNKRARFDYEILETLEAGIVLTGSELKSIRGGHISINECFAGEMQSELFLFNANIKEYEKAGPFNHEARRPRKLLVKKKQANKWLGSVRKKGMTIVPINIYFNHKGLIKVLIGLGKGKKLHDKREAIKERDWKRDQSRILKNKQH